MQNLPILEVRKMHDQATLPMKATMYAAGYDMYASDETIVPAGGKALVSTGIQMAIPHGNYGRIAPRSGLAVKKMIDVGAGVIDSDYRGEVKVLLFNFGTEDFKVCKGDRIAQLIIEKYTMTSIQEVEELTSTERGEAGFGSTGVSKQMPEMVQAEKENNSQNVIEPTSQIAAKMIRI